MSWGSAWRLFSWNVNEEEQSICPITVAACTRLCEPWEADGTLQKGHTSSRRQLGEKDDLLVRTSSASAIGRGTDELGALHKEAGKKQKMGLLPIGNTSQILQ